MTKNRRKISIFWQALGILEAWFRFRCAGSGSGIFWFHSCRLERRWSTKTEKARQEGRYKKTYYINTRCTNSKFTKAPTRRSTIAREPGSSLKHWSSKYKDADCYTVSHRECGQFRPYVHENFEKFEMISTPTGSWIRSRRRRIQLPVGVEIISNFSKFSCIRGWSCPHSRWDRV